MLAVSLLSAAARYHRSGRRDEYSADLHQESKHIYYVLVRDEGTQEAATKLSAEFSKRLGEDEKVQISPASKVK